MHQNIKLQKAIKKGDLREVKCLLEKFTWDPSDDMFLSQACGGQNKKISVEILKLLLLHFYPKEHVFFMCCLYRRKKAIEVFLRDKRVIYQGWGLYVVTLQKPQLLTLLLQQIHFKDRREYISPAAFPPVECFYRQSGERIKQAIKSIPLPTQLLAVIFCYTEPFMLEDVQEITQRVHRVILSEGEKSGKT